MTKNVNFSSTTTIFYTYTLEEYPGRIPDPPLRLSFKDATELLQLRSIFRKATEQLEAVRAKIEAEQMQHGSEASSSTDVSLTETQDSATCSDTSECSSVDSDRGDVLCRTRNLENFDETSMKHKVEFAAQPISALTTPPASPLSPARENAQVSTNTPNLPPSQAEPSSFAAISLHPSPPASPILSTPHSCSPTVHRFSTAPCSEQSGQLQSQPLPHHCIHNHSSQNHGRIVSVQLHPTEKSLIRTPPDPISSSSTIYPNTKILSNASSGFLQDFRSIAQDPSMPLSSCEDMRVKGTPALEW